jgi:hypothetical protein
MRALTVRDRNEPALKELCLSLTDAIEHMHSQKVVHTHIENY